MALSKEDLALIVAAIREAQGTIHPCRLARIAENDIEDVIRIHHEVEPEDLKEAIKFYKNFNRMMADSSRTLRGLIITLGFSTVVGLIVLGAWAEIKSRLGQ
jgi:hypothetical protein